jgi:hypothetical protein
MAWIFKSFLKFLPTSKRERRKHPRRTCSMEAYYMVQGHWYKGSIKDISKGGVYLRSIQAGKFSPGEDIFLVFQLRVLREQRRSKIIRVGSRGIGVEFQTSGCD